MTFPLKKWILRIAAGILLTIVFIFIGTFLILRTESGTEWVIARADASIPGTIATENLAGSLWAGVQIGEFRYTDEAREISASNLVIEIDWSPLLRRTFALQELSASVVTFRNLQPSATPRQPFEFAVSPLPLDVSIDRVRLGQLVLLGEDAQTEINRISLDNGQLSGTRLNIARAAAATEALEASVTALDADLDGEIPLNMAVNWSLASGDWSGEGNFQGSLAELGFNHSVSGDYPATATGTIYLLHRVDPAVNAEVSWQQWQFQEFLLRNGSATVAGVADGYEAEFNFTADLPIDDAALVSGTVSGDTTGLSAIDVRAESLSGNVAATGTFGWQPGLAADVQIQARDIDPSIVAAELSGKLNADAGIRLDGSDALIFSGVAVDGILNDVALHASGDGSATSTQFRCDNCLVEMGDNRLSVDGRRVDEQIALTLSIDAPTLAQLWPGIAGSLTGDGVIGGTQSNPEFSGEFSGQELKFNEWSAAIASIVSEDSSANTVSIAATVTNLVNGENDVGTFTIAGNGPPDNLDVTIDWTVNDLVLAATANVLRTDAGVTGTIRKAELSEPNTGAWSLQDPATFAFQGGDASVQSHEWRSATGVLRIDQATREAGTIRLLADLTQFPLQTANAWLPDSYRLRGTAGAGINLEQANGSWSGSVNWQQEGTVLSVAGIDAEATEIEFSDVRAEANFANGGANITAALQIDPGVTSTLDLSLDGFGPEALLGAELRLDARELDWVPAVVPSIDNFDGVITAVVNAEGPRMAPEFSGTLEWQDGSLTVPALNVPLTDIDIAIDGAANGAATMEGHARAGEGELNIAGRFEDLMQSTRTIELTVSGDGAEVINWSDYRVWASPELTVTGTTSGWNVDGKVEVPRAEILIRELPENAVLPSEDVTVLGREEEARTPTRVTGEAQLVLGEAVRVQAFGLDTRLEGDLRFRLPQDRPPIAEGQVDLVDGVFSAYGQRLTIREGTLTFTGSLDEPLVDVRAVRVIETLDGQITAGIHVRGRGQSLTSTVYSEPVMAEADALSYLVIGRPLSQATESEGGELSGAAIALGVRQASRITEQIGQSLGLDQLALTGRDDTSMALVAGKQINSRLHARYAYGVFSRLGTLLLRYRLSQRLTLEAGAGEQQSIDLLYQVEKQ